MVKKRGSLKKSSKQSSKNHSKRVISKQLPKKSSKKKTPAKKPFKHILKKITPPIKLEEWVRKPPHEQDEDFFVPSKIHLGNYKIPIGIRFLIAYLFLLLLLYVASFSYGISFPTTVLFGELIIGAKAIVLTFVVALFIISMIYGLWTRKSFSLEVSIAFFGFLAVNSLVSLILFESFEHPSFQKLIILSFISLIFVNCIIIWYLIHEKKYFYSEKFKDRPFLRRDGIFLYTLITFWIIALILGGMFTIHMYKDTQRIVDETLIEIGGEYYQAQIVCEKKYSYERDICTMVTATALSNVRPEKEIKELCNAINSDFYRFTCLRSVKS